VLGLAWSKSLTLEIPRSPRIRLEAQRLLKDEKVNPLNGLAFVERMLNLMNPFESHSKIL